ncbi:uri1, prefoldin-like chaperone [Linnemannia zychae]|nr:uri1, prefoldin-like chaperone [Linnemannia zychae]
MDPSQESDRAAESAELAQYFAKFSAALTRLEEELARWKNYEADYQALKTTLLDLPKEISHPVMVPIGNLAFMPGKLIHTNEVLVMLGDNWFVDRSAAQAAEIVDRRMEMVQENITKLKAQEDEIRNKSGMAPGLLGGQEYNEEGLPIVEITEPYFSDDEEEKAAKAKKNQILPGSQKTPEEQARDRAILDRIAELEREDEERERRREAGEDVTSDEETESEEYEELDDDGESEDEFRPKALDSDEEYEEEVWDHSENEQDEEEEETIRSEDSTGGTVSPKKKGVHFAEQVSKTKKFDAMSAPSQVRSATTAPPGAHPTPLAPATATKSKAKAKSPADLYNQMKAKQQSAQTAESDQIVNMTNLESTFANVTKAAAGEPSGLGKVPISGKSAVPEAPALKSALKPAPKKVSLFKARAQAEKESSGEKVTEPEQIQVTAPKKMSKFAQSRAAAAVGTVQERVSAPVKPAIGGVSERVYERNAPIPDAKPTHGVSEVIEKNTPAVKPAHGVSEVVEKNVPAVIKEVVAPVAVSNTRDVIENTFTKPSDPTSTVKPASGGRRKPSLFLQQQQQSNMEPEPAIPGSNIKLENDGPQSIEVSQSKAIPPVVASRSASQGVVKEREPPMVTKSSAKSTKTKAEPKLRTIPVVESAKLSDTGLMKGAVVEHDTIEPVDEEELEEDMLMRQVVSEYQKQRQSMIARHGAFNRDDIERIWEQQVVIPPNMIIPEADVIGEIEEGEEDEEDENEEEEEEAVVEDDRNTPPKKLSLFRASRLTGSLAKQAK